MTPISLVLRLLFMAISRKNHNVMLAYPNFDTQNGININSVCYCSHPHNTRCQNGINYVLPWGSAAAAVSTSPCRMGSNLILPQRLCFSITEEHTHQARRRGGGFKENSCFFYFSFPNVVINFKESLVNHPHIHRWIRNIFYYLYFQVIRQPYLTDKLKIDLKDNSLHCLYLNDWEMAVAAFTLQCPEAKVSSNQRGFRAIKRLTIQLYIIRNEPIHKRITVRPSGSTLFTMQLMQ